MKRLFRLVKKRLAPGGVLLLQLLNYHTILRERPEILKVRTTGDRTFIRMYEYKRNRIDYRILSFSLRGNPKPEIIRTQLRPWTRDELLPLLQKTGFQRMKIYGSLLHKPFSTPSYTDLVIAAFPG